MSARSAAAQRALEGFAAFANRLADRTGEILREHRRRTAGALSAFETKDDESPVTEFDRAIEATMRSMIADACPGHGILGEEFPPTDTESEFVWVIDPIDGTKQFIVGIPVYGTLISLTQGGSPVLGIIDHPVTGERWLGVEGMQSTYSGRPISTRRCPSLADALMSCSNAESIEPERRAGFERVRTATKWRIYGASCYAYASLATGRIDLSVDSGGHREVDYCALVPVVQGAGGKISDWEGRPLTIHSGRSLIAAGDPARHADALRLLQGA